MNANIITPLEPGTRFGITITARMRHADLWEASKKMGSQSALARHIGAAQETVNTWVNLRAAPSLAWLSSDVGRQITDRLFALTGKLPDDLWPAELRHAIKTGHLAEPVEQRQDVEMYDLARLCEQRLALPSPVDHAIADEKHALLEKVLNCLLPREQQIIRLRFGLDGPPQSLAHVATALQITRERVRQIERRALVKLSRYGCYLGPEGLDLLSGDDP